MNKILDSSSFRLQNSQAFEAGQLWAQMFPVYSYLRKKKNMHQTVLAPKLGQPIHLLSSYSS